MAGHSPKAQISSRHSPRLILQQRSGMILNLILFASGGSAIDFGAAGRSVKRPIQSCTPLRDGDRPNETYSNRSIRSAPHQLVYPPSTFLAPTTRKVRAHSYHLCAVRGVQEEISVGKRCPAHKHGHGFTIHATACRCTPSAPQLHKSSDAAHARTQSLHKSGSE